jgi:WD40 repeat protein
VSFALPDALAQLYGAQPETGDICFFPNKYNHVAVAFNFPDAGLIVIWDVHHIRKPYKTLKCLSPISCLCILNENLVVAGTHFGSICLWDLREPGNLHEIYRKSKDMKFVLRHPTYTTDHLPKEAHIASLSKIVHIHSWLVSIDEASAICAWSVVELPSADMAGSEMDLGLRVGGKVKLVLQSQIDLTVDRTFKIRTSEMSCFALDFGEQQNYFIGNAKSMFHGSVYGGASVPKRYEESLSSIPTTIDMSPHNNYQYLLVGYSCGSINLYDKSLASPVSTWLNCCNGALIRIKWDPRGRPVFYTVDSDYTFCMWDLAVNATAPVESIRLSQVGEW